MNSAGVIRLADRIRGRLYTALLCRSLDACGRGTVLSPPLRLLGERGIALGDDVFVGPGSWLQTLDGGRLRIGSGTRMSGYCVLSAAAEIVVEDAVLFGRNVVVVDHNHAFADLATPIAQQGVERVAPVRIGAGSWLAQNVVVTSGATIGRGVVVGANSVVTGDLPDFVVAAGSPAQIRRNREQRLL